MRQIVCGYVRVSTENQLENYSIDEQVERIKSYCKAKDWDLLKIYTDGGYSGGNTNRPGLQQMLADIQNKLVNAVVVYKLDRLSRSQKDTLTLIEDSFLAYNVDFISINENFDTSTPFGRAMIGILSVFAQLEKDQITERFTMGRIARAKAGYFHGGGNAPLGYSYIDGQLEINEYEKIQVQEVYKQFLAGKSINAIMNQMQQQTGKAWSASKVANILRNRLYVGKVKFRGEEYDGNHTPIISPQTYDAVQRLLNSEARELKKTSAQKTPFRAGYLLSSLIYCGKCGARYSANHGYYKCYSRAKSSKKFIVDPNCKNNNWPIEELDALVVNEIYSLLNNPQLLKQITNEKSAPKQTVDKARLNNRLRQIDKEISRLIDLYQLGNISMDDISNRVDALNNERRTIEKILSQCENDEIDSKTLFTDNLKLFEANYTSADLTTKRLLISNIIQSITITNQQVHIEWRI